jgi:hypothetical protein
MCAPLSPNARFRAAACIIICLYNMVYCPKLHLERSVALKKSWQRAGCLILFVVALISYCAYGIWVYQNPELVDGITESDIYDQKERALQACKEDAALWYPGETFVGIEIWYDRHINSVEMDVSVGGRPMECTVFFYHNQPTVVSDVFLIPD